MLDAEVPAARAPEDPVSLVLHTLVESAVKYADPEKEERWIRIEVSTRGRRAARGTGRRERPGDLREGAGEDLSESQAGLGSTFGFTIPLESQTEPGRE